MTLSGLSGLASTLFTLPFKWRSISRCTSGFFISSQALICARFFEYPALRAASALPIPGFAQYSMTNSCAFLVSDKGDCLQKIVVLHEPRLVIARVTESTTTETAFCLGAFLASAIAIFGLALIGAGDSLFLPRAILWHYATAYHAEQVHF